MASYTRPMFLVPCKTGLVQCTRVLQHSTAAYSGQVTFYKVQKNKAMFNWSPCITVTVCVVELLLAETLGLLYGELELLDELLVALVGRQVQPVEAGVGSGQPAVFSNLQSISHFNDSLNRWSKLSARGINNLSLSKVFTMLP